MDWTQEAQLCDEIELCSESVDPDPFMNAPPKKSEDPESNKMCNSDQTIFYLLQTKRILEDDLRNYVWGVGWVFRQ